MKSRLPIFAGLTLAAAIGGAVAAHRQRLGHAAQDQARHDHAADGAEVDLPLAAAAPADRRRAEDDVPAATELLFQACDRLVAHRAISAKVRHRVDLLGHAMAGSGSYAQGPWEERRWRLELKVQAGGDLCTWQQVSDGRHVWTYQQLIGNPKLYRIDLDRVAAAAAESESDVAAAPMDGMALGGLPRLLSSLRDSVAVASVEPGELGGVPVWVLRGGWTREMLATLLPRQQDRAESGAEFDQRALAAHVPDQIVVTLGQDDLFPYRIEYRRTAATQAEDERAERPADKTLVRLELFEVRLDGPVDPLQFSYNPGHQPVADATAEFLRKLGVEGN